MSTKYFVLFSLLKSSVNGASPEACAKELGFEVNSVAPYIFALRNKFGANIESIREGRIVVGYKLLNANEIEDKIVNSRRGRKPKAVVATPQKIKATVDTKKSVDDNGEVATFDVDLEIAKITDREFDDIKSQLGF